MCFFRGILYTAFLAILVIVWLLFPAAFLHCLWKSIVFRLRHCRTGNKDPDILLLNVTEWLRYQNTLRPAITFEEPDGPRAYDDWSAEDKKALRLLYDAIAQQRDAGMPVEPSVEIPNPSAIGRQRFAPSVAKKIFLASVAASLYHEREGDAAWSLEDDNAHLDLLLESRSLFRFHEESGQYQAHFADYGRCTPGDPGRVRRFLEDKDLIGVSRLETIERLFSWGRDHLQHYFGVDTSENYEDHWQYPGFPPVERVIEGTERNGNFNHYTAGCWGTTGFLNLVLRTVNIPVRLQPRCTHALPVFDSENRFLSHGDDLYGLIPRWTFPSSSLLLDLDTLEELFENCANVGVGPRAAAIEHLPVELLIIHCEDPARNDHDQSRVFELVGRSATVDELEQDGLWNRIEQKIADLGGCDAITN